MYALRHLGSGVFLVAVAAHRAAAIDQRLVAPEGQPDRLWHRSYYAAMLCAIRIGVAAGRSGHQSDGLRSPDCCGRASQTARVRRESERQTERRERPPTGWSTSRTQGSVERRSRSGLCSMEWSGRREGCRRMEIGSVDIWVTSAEPHCRGDIVKFITVRDTRTAPGQIWKQLPVEQEMVITNNGKPIALLTPISDETLEQTLSAMRRARAESAARRMQESARKSGADRLTDPEIEAEIRAARRERDR